MSSLRSIARVTSDREQFEWWLKRHRRLAAVTSIPQIVRLYGGAISRSAAYRVAMKQRVRGKRLNQTRYAPFWGIIDWRLPDTVLESIWGVRRGNVRQRRLRLQVVTPSFDARKDAGKPSFTTAVHREKSKASSYTGPRPH